MGEGDDGSDGGPFSVPVSSRAPSSSSSSFSSSIGSGRLLSSSLYPSSSSSSSSAYRTESSRSSHSSFARSAAARTECDTGLTVAREEGMRHRGCRIPDSPSQPPRSSRDSSLPGEVGGLVWRASTQSLLFRLVTRALLRESAKDVRVPSGSKAAKKAEPAEQRKLGRCDVFYPEHATRIVARRCRAGLVGYIVGCRTSQTDTLTPTDMTTTFLTWDKGHRVLRRLLSRGSEGEVAVFC